MKRLLVVILLFLLIMLTGCSNCNHDWRTIQKSTVPRCENPDPAVIKHLLTTERRSYVFGAIITVEECKECHSRQTTRIHGEQQ